MKYRVVYIDFWRDPVIMEEMTPSDRYFYLYLLTNPNTTSTGIYTISKKQIAFELGYSYQSVEELMDRFINHHKLIRYNSDTREVALKNWGKYNLVRGGKPVMDCLTKELGLVKDTSLIEYIAENIKSELMLELYESFFAPNTAKERIVPRQVDNKEKENETKEETYTETEKEKDKNTGSYNIDQCVLLENSEALLNDVQNNIIENIDETSQSLSHYSSAKCSSEELSLRCLKLWIKEHEAINVKYAVEKAIAAGKFSICYINGILKNWQKEGYPGNKEILDKIRVSKQTDRLLKFNAYP